MPNTTWDGLPIADDNPRGVAVIVYRSCAGGVEILILHRAHKGPDYEGDWAWTPPSGARQPGEAALAVAKRELAEETGITGEPMLTQSGSEHWFVYGLEVGPETQVSMDAEHDRYEWVSLPEAICRCQPEAVSQQLKNVGRELGFVSP
ncbi:MAG: NUDIX domain-containing protein [Opitutaceae bacterium]